MDYIEKAILYVGSYFMLFIVACGLGIMKDLPMVYDVLVMLASIYIIWARDEILAHHIIGFQVRSEGSRLKKVISYGLRILMGLIIVKMMLLGLYQHVIILYIIDYITWTQGGLALSQFITLCKIERMSNESKA